MAGWGRFVAGAVIGVAGTIYATNEEIRKRLPGAAQSLPGDVRRRFRGAVDAARQASSERREEILRELKEHDEAERAAQVTPPVVPAVPPEDGAATPDAPATPPEPGPEVAEDEDATRPIRRIEAE